MIPIFFRKFLFHFNSKKEVVLKNLKFYNKLQFLHEIAVLQLSSKLKIYFIEIPSYSLNKTFPGILDRKRMGL